MNLFFAFVFVYDIVFIVFLLRANPTNCSGKYCRYCGQNLVHGKSKNDVQF